MRRKFDIDLQVIRENVDILLKCGTLSMINSIAKEGKVRETQELLDEFTEKELVKEKGDGVVFTERGRKLYKNIQEVKEWNRSGIAELENITILVRKYKGLSKELYERQLPDTNIFLVTGKDELLEAIEDQNVDVVVIERFLKEEVFKEEIEEIIANIREKNAHTPVLVITTATSDSKLMDYGVDDYLVKPIAADELRRAISRSVKARQLPLRDRQLLFLLAQKTDLEEEYSYQELRANSHYKKVVRDLRRVAEGRHIL